MGFWRKTGFVAGVASGVLPVVWMGKLTWRAGRAMLPPVDLLRPPKSPEETRSEAAQRFAAIVARKNLQPADLARAQRQAEWRMLFSVIIAAGLILYGVWVPAAWTLIPLCFVYWLYGRYQSQCLLHQELPSFGNWLHQIFWKRRNRDV
jgi:hypothetical protein